MKMRPIYPQFSSRAVSLLCDERLPDLSSRSKEGYMTHRRGFVVCATGRVFAVAVLAMLGILSLPVDAAAQSQVGTLVGNVRDESGGAIPGATVTALEVRTNISRTAVSNEAGNYTFTNVSPGVYKIEGEL